MNVSVKCFAQLATDGTCDYRESRTQNLQDGARVTELIDQLGIKREEVKLIYVNNLHATPESPLHDGDRVAFAPATGGM